MAIWARFHFAVLARASGGPSKWIIQPFIPSVPPDEDGVGGSPGQEEISVFVRPVQFRALSISAPRAGIPVYS